MTRELEVVIEVIEQGPKAYMPLTWFMEAPVPAAANDKQESKTDNTLIEGTAKASPEQLRGAAGMLRTSTAAAASNVLGHGYGSNLTAFPNMHQFDATPGSFLGAPRRNSRELSTLDTSAPMMAMPRMQRREAALNEIAAARQRASEAVDAAMGSLAAARRRASEAVATLEALQRQEMALRLAQQDQIIAAYQTTYNNAGNGREGEAPAPTGQVAVADSARAMQNQIMALASRRPSGSQQDDAARRVCGSDAYRLANMGPYTGPR